MTTITASQVKELRDRTGIGMSDCKKALEKNNGDLDAAIKYLREQGAVKQAKRADRVASEGRIAQAFNAENTTGIMAQLTCETDFVSRNEEFIAVAEGAAQHGLAENATTSEAVKSVKLADGRTVDAAIDDLRTKIGEKIDLSEYESVSGDVVAGYVHFSGKSGAVIAADASGLAADKRGAVADGLRNICMHIVANKPLFLDSSEIDEKTANDEREIYLAQARQEGKPEAILPKIVEGKMRAFFKQSCLVDQPFAMEPDKTIAQVAKDLGKDAGVEVKLKSFKRFEIGGK